MLPFLALLLICQLSGEVLARLLGLPIPGPVLGLVLLFVGLTARRRPAPTAEEHADRLLGNLSLLFVPAGVGVLQYLPVLAAEWPAVTASILGSTLAAVVVTGLTLRVLTRGPAASDREEVGA